MSGSPHTADIEPIGLLIQKYLRSRGLTQGEFAKKLGISLPYLSQIINGARVPGKKLIPKLAELIGENEEKLRLLAAYESERNPQIKAYLEKMYIEQYVKPEQERTYRSEDGREYPYSTIPVLTYCEAGVEGLWDPDAYPKGEGMYRVPRPVDVDDPQAVAFEIKGDSMVPKFEEGDIVIVSPREPIRNGDYVVVRLNSTGEIMAKRIRYDKGMIVLESVNPSVPPIIITDRADLAFCYRIVHVILGSSRRF